jgi:proliferating cell nuclear antigen
MITIDSEHLGVPDTTYSSVIKMNASEFTRICRELYQLSETVTIETNTNYVKFSVTSEQMGGSIKIESNSTGDGGESISINVNNINIYF